MRTFIYSAAIWALEELLPEIAKYLAFSLLPVFALVVLGLFVSSVEHALIAALVATNVIWLFLFYRARKTYQLEIDRLVEIRRQLIHENKGEIALHKAAQNALSSEP